jgi:hypothetical protein
LGAADRDIDTPFVVSIIDTSQERDCIDH